MKTVWDLLPGAIVGAIVLVIAYFLYLVAKKGLPAAIAWAKGWWNAGKADLANLKGDVAALKAKVAALESKFVTAAVVKPPVAAVQQSPNSNG